MASAAAEAVLIVLKGTTYPVSFIKTSRNQGVQGVRQEIQCEEAQYACKIVKTSYRDRDDSVKRVRTCLQVHVDHMRSL